MKYSLLYPVLSYAALGALAHNGQDHGNDNDDDGSWGDWSGFGSNFGSGDDWGGKWGGWDGFGSSCASSCFSSYWASATPTPTAFCDRSNENDLASCVSSACTATAGALDTYNSAISSACALLSSCTSSGTYTYTYGPGQWNVDDSDGDHHGSSHGAATVTVTGCPWNEGPWGIWGDGDGDDDDSSKGWGHWGSGWKYATRTETVTVTQESGGAVTQSAIVVGQAVSGSETRMTTFTADAATTAAQESGSNDDNSAATGLGGMAGAKAVGAGIATLLLAVVLM